ncbi:GMP reductase 2 isoform X2 [Manis pentadactyla]|uniref:GMP reductase 2 isoform X2 n=1 Tax=Manis pentadactyla TaxID=143292 RepID=UPI00255C854B|nr:GMP reductase 2 isoform X2 [Manis pentadactyla]
MPHIDNDVKLDFKDVLLRPKRSTLRSRSEVDLTRSFSFRNSKQMYTGIPIIAANMDTVGTFEMAKVLCKFSLFTAVHKHYSLKQWQEFASQNPDCLEHLAASSGTGSSDFEQLEQILEAVPQVKYICLDVANGYSEHFVEFVKNVRKRFPQHTIMAGNVVTGEMVEELILSGADIIKVGIGPGSVCTTRKKTGVGYPQLSAVLECADAAHGLKGHIISDGGCSCPGDVAKAFGQATRGNPETDRDPPSVKQHHLHDPLDCWTVWMPEPYPDLQNQILGDGAANLHFSQLPRGRGRLCDAGWHAGWAH